MELTGAGSVMLFHLLGPVEAHASDGRVIGLPAGKPTAVLATLLLNANRWVRVEQLVAATWPELDAPSSAAANLKTYVWQLRKALPEPVDGSRIDSRPGAYRLRVDAGELDVDRAEGLATDARLALTDGLLTKSAALFAEALDLWRGEPCDGVRLEVPTGLLSWLAELRRELQEGLAETYLRLGRTREAIALLRALTDEDPFREGSWARWMLALSDAGRHGAALAVYERVRVILADELGAEPGRELRDALAVVHRCQRARLPSNRRDLVRDVPDFTGRDAEVARLCALGSATGVPVGVIDGMPGVGKTALAVHVAHRLAPSFPDAQLQVSLGEASPDEILGRLLAALGVSDVPGDVSGRAALWRAELAHRHVLVLLDDARQCRAGAAAAARQPRQPGAGDHPNEDAAPAGGQHDHPGTTSGGGGGRVVPGGGSGFAGCRGPPLSMRWPASATACRPPCVPRRTSCPDVRCGRSDSWPTDWRAWAWRDCHRWPN